LSHQILPSDFFAAGVRRGKNTVFFSPAAGKKPMGSVEYLGHRFSINHPGALANPKVSNMGPLLQELKKLEQFESMPQWCLTTAPIVCTNFP